MRAQFNVSPTFVLEMLHRVSKVFKVGPAIALACLSSCPSNLPPAPCWQDYCGVLTEESIRKNFILVYELLDEVIVRQPWRPAAACIALLTCARADRRTMGLRRERPRSCSRRTCTASLCRLRTQSQSLGCDGSAARAMRAACAVCATHAAASAALADTHCATAQMPAIANTRTTPSSSVHKPIVTGASRSKGQRNEIFVDILERLTVVFNSSVRAPVGGRAPGMRRCSRTALLTHGAHRATCSTRPSMAASR